MPDSLLINRLNQRVTIQQTQNVSDGQGGQTVTWKTLATVYAEVRPINNFTTERNLGQQVYAAAGYRLTIRARNDIKAGMRILWKNHVLLIASWQENEQMLELLAHEEPV